jgi:hypothetical protein
MNLHNYFLNWIFPSREWIARTWKNPQGFHRMVTRCGETFLCAGGARYGVVERKPAGGFIQTPSMPHPVNRFLIDKFMKTL